MEKFKEYLQQSIEDAKIDLVTTQGDISRDDIIRQQAYISALEDFYTDFEDSYEEFMEEIFKFSDN